MRRTIYLSASAALPRYKPLPLWKRLLSWIIPFKSAYIVVHDGHRCYTSPDNLKVVTEILSKYYDVKLIANLSSVTEKK